MSARDSHGEQRHVALAIVSNTLDSVVLDVEKSLFAVVLKS